MLVIGGKTEKDQANNSGMVGNYEHTSCITADLAILITLAFTFSSTKARNAAFQKKKKTMKHGVETDESHITTPKTYGHASEEYFDPEVD